MPLLARSTEIGLPYLRTLTTPDFEIVYRRMRGWFSLNVVDEVNLNQVDAEAVAGSTVDAASAAMVPRKPRRVILLMSQRYGTCGTAAHLRAAL